MEGLAETVKRCGDGEGRVQKMHLLVAVCILPLVCMHGFSLVLFYFFFKCVRDRVKCVWETEAELECLLLMGLTLLSAVQPCCVGKRAVVSPCHCQECFPVFVFILILSALTVPLFFPRCTFHTLSAASNPAPFRHELHPLSAI